jgi:hypothetical protein
MNTHKYTEQELKLTAVVYATRPAILSEVQASGKLPKKVSVAGFPTALNHLVRSRGIEPQLSSSEEVVFRALLAEKRLPAGGVIIVPEGPVVYSLEPDQKIIICPPPRTEDWEG